MTDIGNKMRSLDSFLLFMTTVLGLVFSLLNVLLAQKEFVYGFLPLLVIGAVVPIYVGFIRGAIIIDTLQERVRGWIYFLNGVFLYVFAVTLSAIPTVLGNLTIETRILSAMALFIGYLALGYFLGAGYLRQWFCNIIFDAFKFRTSPLAEKTFKDTASSAYDISLYIYIAFTGLTRTSQTQAIIALLFLSLAFATFLINETTIRKWTRLLPFSDFLEVEFKRGELRREFRIVARALVIISLGAFGLLWIAYELLPFEAKILLLVLGIAGFSATTLWPSKEAPIIKIKDNVPKDIESELARLVEHVTKKGKMKQGS